MKYVCFHSNCFDGFGAAFSAWMKFGNDAKYIPVSYGEKSITDILFNAEDELYIVDFSVSNEEFEELSSLVSKVVMLDHHKTALERFTGLSPYPDPVFKHGSENTYVYFNMNESGALMAWKYFHSEKPVPQLIKWVSDRDLWQFKLEGTKEAHAYIAAHKRDFDLWYDMMIDMEVASDPILKAGRMLLQQQDITVDMICKKSYFTNIAGYSVPVVNSTSHWSEVGNELVKKYPEAPFAASYADQPDGTRMFSLRSSGFDVSSIAQLFGGGGHKQAAGFRVPITLQLPQLTPMPIQEPAKTDDSVLAILPYRGESK